jgi:hypothetical protein
MSGSEISSGSVPMRGRPEPIRLDELVSRIRTLAELERPKDGYPIEWLVEARSIGDMNAVASLALSCHD